jgi:hypothetical protein
MSLLGGLGDVISGIGGLVVGGLNYAQEKKANEDNLAFQKEANAQNVAFQQENLAYQKQLQQDIFGREDNSIQRRVADLKAAGLSPVLAAGQGAGTGGTVATSAPQVNARQSKAPQYDDNDGLNQLAQVAPAIMALMQGQANIAKTNAETDAISVQKSKTEQEIRSIEQANSFNSVANPIRLEALANDIKLGNINITNAQLNSMLRQFDVDNLDITRARLVAEKSIVLEELTQSQKETLIKTIALQMKEAEKSAFAYNLDWYSSRGLPTDRNQNNTLTAGTIAGSAVKGLSDILGSGIRKLLSNNNLQSSGVSGGAR